MSPTTALPGSRFDDWHRPAWHEDSKCANSGLPVTLWDAAWPPGHRRRDVSTNIAAALTLCKGCPVAQACAAEALATNCTGTIRAGIPLTTFRQTKFQTAALQAIAAGGDMAQAVERYRGAL
ncbi:hypothetical protein HMPREF3153_09685 [Corynebacterium sp. HMSC06C06]|uniref:WhiB family transcriptional regulator n=1 Tax=Corynebacterium striatum TaxID=43770 RepID=A0ABX7DCN7_CORST|nr:MULTISPECIES: WhiB family transcriptional regulator [Corynebacterium]OFT50488.1 hypothetical protein HMPREF3153_09685 [Corynebacterium sp. HMSC06C06]QQU76457.1 WhiB family transcriptional regulator [Corynebacterium striatum]